MARPISFDFEESVNGLILFAKSSELSAACLSDGEIDYWIGVLKDDLDHAAANMKQRLSNRQKESIFDL